MLGGKSTPSGGYASAGGPSVCREHAAAPRPGNAPHPSQGKFASWKTPPLVLDPLAPLLPPPALPLEVPPELAVASFVSTSPLEPPPEPPLAPDPPAPSPIDPSGPTLNVLLPLAPPPPPQAPAKATTPRLATSIVVSLRRSEWRSIGYPPSRSPLERDYGSLSKAEDGGPWPASNRTLVGVTAPFCDLSHWS